MCCRHLRRSHWVIAAIVAACLVPEVRADEVEAADPAYEAVAAISRMDVGPRDWPQWGGTSVRNNTPMGRNIPVDWDVDSGRNIRWSVPLGSETYGNPVVASGRVFVGTNNAAGYLPRYPKSVDLGVLLCFRERDGDFLWQHSSEKLASGSQHDWPLQGICCAPCVDGNRAWYVTSRGEVVCLEIDDQTQKADADSPADGRIRRPNEPGVIWMLDMMAELQVSQHNMCSCSVTCAGNLLFVITGNGVDEDHQRVVSPQAPSFLCLDRDTGRVLWADNSPGDNILHGQWSSPAYGVVGGVPQVLFGGGDGYLYSFAAEGQDGQPVLLWKFDCNPKNSRYALGGRSTRGHLIGTPVICDGLIYVGVGEDPEHGEGQGHLWCIDPTRRGDVSPTIVYNRSDPDTPIAHRRLQALDEGAGDFERPNPNSAAVWHYQGEDPTRFDTTMHRTCGTVAVRNNLLFVADFSGLFHCLDAATGKPHWTHDLFSASWASPLIVEDRVYIGDENGAVSIFRLSAELELINEVNMGASVYTTPVVANDTLYIASRNRLFAIATKEP